MAADSKTRVTLIERLEDGSDSLAWEEFFSRYWRPMYAFAKRRNCSPQTAEDVIQDALLAVFENRQVFSYDPSRGRFRNWLYTIVRQKIALRRRGEKDPPAPREGDIEDSGTAPDQAWNALFEKNLLAVLLEVVRREVSPETYQAFEMTALHGLSGGEVARLTGLSRNAVYQARKRVMRRLSELGAPYGEDGTLREPVRELLELFPDPVQERSVNTRVRSTMESA